MRPIWAVIKAIKTRIPFDFKNRAALLNELDEVGDLAGNADVQTLFRLEQSLFDVCFLHIDFPELRWQEEVLDIALGRADYKEYLTEDLI
jgi:hypothetical protein